MRPLSIIKLGIVLFYFGGLFGMQDVGAEVLTKEATYYSDNFEGGGTANGDVFHQSGFSVASCGEFLGTYLYVSKGGTGVVVDNNDRPNCARYPDIIDLSQSAFRLFAPLSAGRISDVSVASLGSAPTSTEKGFLPKDVFAHLGVILDSDIPTVLFAGEGIVVRGRVTSPSDYVIVYLDNSDKNIQYTRLVKVSKNNTFTTYIPLPKYTGDYTFVLARGKSFDTNKYTFLSLIDENSLSYPSLSTEKFKITPKISFQDTHPAIILPEPLYGELTIRQGQNIYETKGKALIFSDVTLVPGKSQVQIKGYRLSTPSALDRSTRILSLYSGSVILDRKHEIIAGDLVTSRVLNNIANFRFKVPKDYKIRSEYYITLPDGSVKELKFDSRFIASGGYLIPGSSINFSYPLSKEGTYILELVRQDGLAYANIPVSKGTIWNVLEPISENQIKALRTNAGEVISGILSHINNLRTSLDLSQVILDNTLSKLAQAKVDDMIARGYQAHQDPDGLYIDGLAKKLRINPGKSIGENIGYGTVSDLALQDGLEESGVHRYNMLRSHWSRIGIGYAVTNNKVYLVHVFGE